MTTAFHHLSTDNIGVITSFLPSSDKRMVACANKQLYNDMALHRTETLNESCSLQFLSDPKFQTTVLNTFRKIGLCLKKSEFDIQTLEQVARTKSIHSIHLSQSFITDVSALGHVHTLDLSRCNGITDVSALGHVHTLNLSGCNGITDVSALGNVHTLIC